MAGDNIAVQLVCNQLQCLGFETKAVVDFFLVLQIEQINANQMLRTGLPAGFFKDFPDTGLNGGFPGFDMPGG
ncbi:hypothetical protein LH51_09085 [Nitrincola sp. A-D6]|nr:hypothetical protein [Nitrincola sp. A-D6]KGK42190.1 hypothetical protein LH51_09085 [Nitrincola sp. A-D6]